MGRDGAPGGTVGVAVAGRGVVVPDDEAEEVLLGPGEDCTLVGLRGKEVSECNAPSLFFFIFNFFLTTANFGTINILTVVNFGSVLGLSTFSTI